MPREGTRRKIETRSFSFSIYQCIASMHQFNIQLTKKINKKCYWNQSESRRERKKKGNKASSIQSIWIGFDPFHSSTEIINCVTLIFHICRHNTTCVLLYRLVRCWIFFHCFNSRLHTNSRCSTQDVKDSERNMFFPIGKTSFVEANIKSRQKRQKEGEAPTLTDSTKCPQRCFDDGLD